MIAPSTEAMTATARQYLLDVERELADLPADERAELLADLAMHLSALEQERDEQPWEARLGAPADYARELRAAAGLPERVAMPLRGGVSVRALRERLGTSRTALALGGFLLQLRPAWWLLRGYLLVLLPSLRTVNGARDFPVPAPAGSHALGFGLIVLAVVASVAVGRRRLPRPAAAVVLAGNLVLLVLAVTVYDEAAARLTRVRIVHGAVTEFATGSSPLVSRHGPVTNVFPYSADGKPLSGVLLFDQDGRPLLTGVQQWWPDRCLRTLTPPLAADGVPVAFSYPLRYLLAPGPRDLAGSPLRLGRTCQSQLDRPVVPVPRFSTAAPTRP